MQLCNLLVFVCVCVFLVGFFFGTLIKNRPDFTVTITIVPFSNVKFALSVHFNGERRLTKPNAVNKRNK